MPRHRQLRAVVCLACVLHLGMGHWWLGVNAHGSVPYIMSRETLQQHYSRINDASRVTVRYATVAQTARRIRDITGPDDRIAMLFYDPRIMYMAQRPPVHRVIIPMDVNRTQYAEFMKGIETGKPTLLVARIPEGYQGGADPKDVERMIFSDAGKLFGPGAEMLRELYALSETIGDVAILRPRVDGISDQSASLSAPRRAIR